jgi:hypothetical protein
MLAAYTPMIAQVSEVLDGENQIPFGHATPTLPV